MKTSERIIEPAFYLMRDAVLADQLVSISFDKRMFPNLGFHGVVTGNPVGSIIVEVHADPSNGSIPWLTLPEGTFSVNGASTLGFSYVNLAYGWIRLRYTAVSGSGTITAILNGYGG